MVTHGLPIAWSFVGRMKFVVRCKWSAVAVILQGGVDGQRERETSWLLSDDDDDEDDDDGDVDEDGDDDDDGGE